MVSGEGDLPQAELCQHTGGLGEAGWQTPKQQGLIPSSRSTYHSRSFPEGLGSKGSLSQLQLHHNRLQLSLLPAQAARKEPRRAVPSLSPEKKKGWPKLHWLHNSCCQHDWSRGMSEDCSEVAPAQQTHSFCRLQHSHLPCSSSRGSQNKHTHTILRLCSAVQALCFRLFVSQNQKNPPETNSSPYTAHFRINFSFISSQCDSSSET